MESSNKWQIYKILNSTKTEKSAYKNQSRSTKRNNSSILIEEKYLKKNFWFRNKFRFLNIE